MILPIIHIGNPLLRQISASLTLDEIHSDQTQKFIDDLIETMRHANGAGIAAIQVGRPIRIFVMEVNDNPRYPYKPNIPLTIMINPEITYETLDTFENYEGCLSVPGLRGKVKRYLEIRVNYLDRDGKPHVSYYKGITAGTVQHEYDHIDGLLFIDKVEDTTTLCTWDEFVKNHQENFAATVKLIVNKYGS